jgi:hypothetical protein
MQPGSKEYQGHIDQLERLQFRAQVLFKALRVLYASLGLFAAAALITVIGSALAYFQWQFAFHATAVIAFLTGGSAVVGLASGCALMVQETRVAVQNLAEEADLIRSRYRSIDSQQP